MKRNAAKGAKNGLREKIRQDLLDQLESDGTVGQYYTDLVDDYMSMWDTKNELMEDIRGRGGGSRVHVQYRREQHEAERIHRPAIEGQRADAENARRTGNQTLHGR